jgi:Domain of unknown function (DUF4403)
MSFSRRPHPHLPLLGLVLLGCSGPPHIDAPPPATTADVQQVPELPASTLAVPIAIDLAPVLSDLERAVPRTFGDLEQRLQLNGNDRIHVAFEAERGPFRASLSGETARVAATIRYRGRAWYNPPIAPEISASCGTDAAPDDRPRARIALTSRLTLTPDWGLRSAARVERVAPASDAPRDLCRVTAFSIDVTGRVMDAARDLLARNTTVIDHAIASIDLRSKAADWWNTIQSPIEITDSVWLVIEPVAARRGAVHGVGQTLFGEISLTAHPHLVVGPRPVVELRPLPDIERTAIDDGLHILASGVIDYGVASDFLTRELAGRSIESAGHHLVIRNLHLAGIGAGRLSVEVDFDGSARGRVFLVGTPRLDPATGQVHFPDLDFDIATSSLLVSGLAWVGHGQLLQYLRDQARLPIGDAIVRARELLLEGLNRNLSDDVRIHGTVLSITPLGVYATRRALLLHAHALASAGLSVGALPQTTGSGDTDGDGH